MKPPASTPASDVPNQVAHPAFQGLSDLRESFKRDLLFCPLNVADVVSRQIGLFRQPLLAEPGLPALGADGFSQDSIDSSARRQIHNVLSNQNARIQLPTSGWYLPELLCDFLLATKTLF